MFGSVLECCELTGVSLLWTRMALANEAKIFFFFKLGIYHGVYFDCMIIMNLRGYIDLLDTSVIVLLMIYCGLCFFYVIYIVELLVSSVICKFSGLVLFTWVFFYFVYSSQYSYLFWIMYLL